MVFIMNGVEKGKMEIKLIALDLDRTTLNAQGKLSPANRAAILRAIDKGIHVCIASGRAFDTLPVEVVSIPGIEYAITSNGAAVYRIEDKLCMRSFLLKSESVEAIMKATAGYPVVYEAFIGGAAYAAKAYVEQPAQYGATPQSVAYVQSTRHLLEDMTQFILENKTQLDSMDIVVKDESMKQQITALVEETAQDVYITSSIKNLVEIAYKDAGKKSGVQFIAAHLGIQRENIAAFGDADNDLDMIQYAGCGIAMENASERLLASADYVTRHHDSDGLAYAFEKILNI